MAQSKKLSDVLGWVEIEPLKDFRFFLPPKYDIMILEGEKIKVPQLAVPNLIAEGVIRNDNPKEK